MRKKVLIIGYGSISKKLLKVLRHYKNLDLAILRTSIKKKGNNKNKFFFKLQDAIKFKPNYVLICSSANLHSYYFKKFKNFQNNIFVEKPLILKQEEIKIFKSYGFNFMVGYFLRFHPAVIYLKKYIQKNLSKLRMVNLEVGYDVRQWRPGRSIKNTVSTNKKLGGGTLFELSHEVDIITWFIGFPNQIYCENNKISNLNIDVEDVTKLIFNYKNKRIIASLNLDFIQKKYSRNMKLIFDDKILTYDFVKNKVFIYKNKTIKKVQFKSGFNKAYEKQIDFFIKKFSKKKRNYHFNVSNQITSIKLSNLLIKCKVSNKLNKKIRFN